MRVLLINVNCKYSSTGKIVYDLYSQLRADGQKAMIAYGRGALVKEEGICRFSPKWEVCLHALLTRITGYTGCFSCFATKRLFKIIDEFQPDVVHLHEIHGYYVNIVPLVEYLKEKKIKTVWTFHCEFMYTGKCGYAYECEKWQTQCEACPRLKDYPNTLFFDRSRDMFKKKKKMFDGFGNLVIVAPSHWLADRIRRSFLGAKRIEVIRNGININVFCKKNTDDLRKKYRLVDEKIVLAAAPKLMSERKGGQYVIELAQRMADPKIKFIMIGVDNPEEIRADNIIAESIIRDQNLLAKYYSLADVFLICSKQENYPTVCVEAAACETPVAGFSTGGTAETVATPNGMFAKYGDLDDLQKKVEHLLEQGYIEVADKKNGFKGLSKEKMYEEYRVIYSEKGEDKFCHDKF